MYDGKGSSGKEKDRRDGDLDKRFSSYLPRINVKEERRRK
jgi:hypothetical protein